MNWDSYTKLNCTFLQQCIGTKVQDSNEKSDLLIRCAWMKVNEICTKIQQGSIKIRDMMMIAEKPEQMKRLLDVVCKSGRIFHSSQERILDQRLRELDVLQNYQEQLKNLHTQLGSIQFQGI